MVSNNSNISSNFFTQGITNAELKKIIESLTTQFADDNITTEDAKELKAQILAFSQKTLEEKDAQLAKDTKDVENLGVAASSEGEFTGSKSEFNDLLQDYSVDQIKQIYINAGVKPEEEVEKYIDANTESEKGIEINIGNAGVDTQ